MKPPPFTEEQRRRREIDMRSRTGARRASVRAAGCSLAALLLGAAGAPLAGQPERLVVPLSDPARPATLAAALVVGSIHVSAGNDGEVVIEAAAPATRRRDGSDPDPDPLSGKAEDEVAQGPQGTDRGLRRIPNPTFELTAEEENNKVSVRGGRLPLDLRIRVPGGSSLWLSTVSGGSIEVEGVSGELELHNTNGSIEVRGAQGPVTANTVNGSITVVLVGGPVPGPMAFSTLNGNVDVTLPAAAAVNLRVRSDHGEIYTDFDVALTLEEKRVEKGTSGSRRYRVSIAKELVGSIGGGGPEVYLKSFNGDVILRRGGG